MYDLSPGHSPLLQLPDELIISVAFYLNLIDLGNFRLSCKAIDAALFDPFAREHFEKRQFMVEHSDLDTLVSIARSHRVAPYLKDLLLLTLWHPFGSDPWHNPNVYGTGLDTNDDSIADTDATAPHWLPRNVMLASGQARDMLVYALLRLPSLEAVGIRDYISARTDRPGACTRSLPNNVSLTTSEQSCLVFELLLAAIHRAPSARPVKLEVILRHRIMSTDAFRMPLPNPAFMDSPYAGAPLMSVTRLLLTVSLDQGSEPHIAGSRNRSIRRLTNFLQSGVPNIEMLRLNFRPRDALTDHFLHRLTNLEPLPGASLPLPYVTRLELGMLCARSQVLCSVLSRWPLKAFTLWRVDLLTDRHATPDDPTWSNFLIQLATALPTTIESAMIGSVGQFEHNVRSNFPRTRIAFATIDQPADDSAEQTHESIVNYDTRRLGQPISYWLSELAQRVKILNATVARADSGGESDESDE